MKHVVISGTGLYQPPHVITNAELVQSYNAYADLQNARHATRIAAVRHHFGLFSRGTSGDDSGAGREQENTHQ